MTGIRSVIGCAVALATIVSANAAQRTFVATSGSDLNACTVSAPCRSFDTALANTDAAGEIIVLESGGYGRVTITQSVTIEAPPGVFGGISVFAATNGIDIAAPGAVVHLRGLAINGQGGDHGVNVTDVGELRIDRCRITAMSGRGILVSAAGVVVVTQTEVSGNDGNGIEANGVLDLSVEGAVVARNATGIRLTGGVRAALHDVSIKSNFSAGVSAIAGPAATPTVILADRLEVAHNGSSGMVITGVAAGVGTLSVVRSSIHHNAGNGVLGNGGLGPVTITVSDSVVSGHPAANPTLFILGGGGRMIASRNVVVDNGNTGLHNSGAAVFESTGDNVVRNNNGGGPQTSGVITVIGGT